MLCLQSQWSAESKIQKLVAAEEHLEAFFIHSIPSQRNLHSENLNVLEYFARRLDDYAYVIRSVILQCMRTTERETRFDPAVGFSECRSEQFKPSVPRCVNTQGN